MDEKNKQVPKNENTFVDANREASAKNEKLGEAEMKVYDELFQRHQAEEDISEVSSTDDV